MYGRAMVKPSSFKSLKQESMKLLMHLTMHSTKQESCYHFGSLFLEMGTVVEDFRKIKVLDSEEYNVRRSSRSTFHMSEISV